MKVLLAEDDLRLGKMLKNILSRQAIRWTTRLTGLTPVRMITL